MFVNKKKVYRFALYGLSGSGKTCVLTALAMPRYSHPLGYSCLWNTIDASDNPLVERSQNWMVEAIHKLEEQELPPSNPIGEEFIFEYDFTASTHQTFRIELVDYSGDLINPNINHSAVAKKLRQKFKNLDGILVLADAPFQEQAEHVQTYCGKQAFADSMESCVLAKRGGSLRGKPRTTRCNASPLPSRCRPPSMRDCRRSCTSTAQRSSVLGCRRYEVRRS